MPTRRSKKAGSTSAPHKRKKVASKKGRSSSRKKVAKRSPKKVAKRSPKKVTKRSPKKHARDLRLYVKPEKVLRVPPKRVAPPPPVWPPRPEPRAKRGKIAKPPKGFKRVVLSYEEERSDSSDIMEKKGKIIDFVHANNWRETGLPTSDELYDYLKWGAEHFDLPIGSMYRFYLGYDVE